MVQMNVTSAPGTISRQPQADKAFQNVTRLSAAVVPGNQLESQGLKESVAQLVHGQSGQLGLLSLTYIY